MFSSLFKKFKKFREEVREEVIGMKQIIDEQKVALKQFEDIKKDKTKYINREKYEKIHVVISEEIREIQEKITVLEKEYTALKEEISTKVDKFNYRPDDDNIKAEKKLKCNQCEQEFDENVKFETHMKIHNPIGQYKCELFGKGFHMK